MPLTASSAQVAGPVAVQPGDPAATAEAEHWLRDHANSRDAVVDLPDPERQVIVMRFFQDLNQDAIAARIGNSQMQMSRLLRRALVRLRAQLVEP